MFSLLRPLPSSDSLAFASFTAFAGTMGRSDSSVVCTYGYDLFVFPYRSEFPQTRQRSPGSQQKVSPRAWGL